ncbi:hypothetical protein EV2_013133 [Malus domestica]
MADATNGAATPNSLSHSAMNSYSSMTTVVNIKLDRTNYPLWLAQILPILKSRNLMGYVDGSIVCPPKHLPDAAAVNPTYTTWVQHDQMILSWINGSLTPSVLSVVASKRSSHDTWEALEQRYASTSQNRILFLRNELMQTKKGDMSIADYLDRMNSITDNLALAGNPVNDDELVQIILNNLGPAYEMTVSDAQARDTPIAYPTLEALLLTTERRMAAQNAQPMEAAPVNAFVTARGRGRRLRGNGRGAFQHARGGGVNPRGFFPRNNNQRPNSTYNGEKLTLTGDRITCQICGKQGHPALDCYQRMNAAYEGRIPTKQLTAMVTAPVPFNHQNNGQWLLDTGANAHVTPDIQNLVNPKEYNGNQNVGGVGNDTGLSISHIGSNHLQTQSCSFKLPNILRCPTASTNIISAHRFTLDNKCYLLIFPHFFLVKDLKTRKTLFCGRCENGLYPFVGGGGQFINPISVCLGIRVSAPKWHSRLGHPAFSIIKFLISNKQVPIHGTVDVTFCPSCPLGKSTKLPFSTSESVSQFPLQLLHSDVWCSPVISIEGFRYYVLFVDDYSRYSWIFPMKNKSEVFEIFVQFKAKVENMFNTSIKTLQCDEGGEYKSHCFQRFLATNGISQRFSCPKHPEQNGLAERKHRHIVETSIVLLTHSHIPNKYWFDACSTATYLINRLPTRVLSHKSPYETLFQKPPHYEMLKVFGCKCFPWLVPYAQHKLQPKSKPCVFLGYSLNHQGYKCLDLSTRRIYLSRHVLFDEDSFPFKELTSLRENVDHTGSFTSPDLLFTFPILLSSLPLPNHNQCLVIPSQPTSTTPNLQSPDPINFSQNPVLSCPSNPSSPNHSLNEQVTSVESPTSQSHPPSDHDTASLPQASVQRSHMTTRSQSGIHKPNPKYALHVSTDQPLVEPTCFSQAVKHHKWRDAMVQEFNALQRCGTWELVPYHSQLNVLPNKWVFKIKRRADGSVERHKARLVANGFHQQHGLDYTETFSPVVKHSTIRLVLSLAVSNKWHIRQLDVQNAFLHGFLKEEVYMRQPAGFIDEQHPNHVCKLQRSIYGLKQAPRAWFQRFSEFLLQLGFQASTCDYSLFVFNHSGVYLILLIYVDDILLTGNSTPHMSRLIHQLGTLFSMKDLGSLHYFLGVEVTYHGDQMHLNQAKYAVDLLKRTKFLDAKPISTPVSCGQKLSAYNGEPHDDVETYRSVVGALQYLTITRPDLSYAVNQVCQFMQSPKNTHWMAVKRILRYVKSTYNHGLVYTPGTAHLTAYSDADYAGNPDTRHSTGGFCIYLGSNLVSWSSKKQKTVSRSSSEAEYRQLAYTAAELSWFRSLFRDLHLLLDRPTIWCDNVSSIALASNPVFHSRTKHLEVDYHYVREKVVRQELLVNFICSQDQIADLFTKGLSSSRFKHLVSKLPVVSPPVSLRGAVRPSPSLLSKQS